MKKIISLFLIGFTLTSCETSDSPEVSNPPDGVSFQIEKTNSTNNYITNTNIAVLNQKSSNWSKFHSDNLHYIRKGIMYDLTLENGETITFGLEFIKDDPNSDLLILDGTGNSGFNWDYLSSQTEAIDFYQNSDLRVHIGDYNVIWLGKTSESNIVNVETILENGIEKSHISINFNGSARGYYDPNGEYMPVYNITNGVFRGVIE